MFVLTIQSQSSKSNEERFRKRYEFELEMAFGVELLRVWWTVPPDSDADGRRFVENARAMDRVYAAMHRLAVYRPNLGSTRFQNEWLAQRMKEVLGRLEEMDRDRDRDRKRGRSHYFEGLMWSLNGLCRLNYDVVHPHIDRLVFFR